MKYRSIESHSQSDLDFLAGILSAVQYSEQPPLSLALRQGVHFLNYELHVGKAFVDHARTNRVLESLHLQIKEKYKFNFILTKDAR